MAQKSRKRNKMTKDEYEQQGINFLQKTNTSILIEFDGYKKHFANDKEKRDVYKVTFTRGERSFFLMFGQSLNATGKYISKRDNTKTNVKRAGMNDCINKDYEIPSAYSVLVCLQKYEVGTFKDFCSDFDYDTDSITAHKTYKAVCEEYKNVCSLWNEQEVELLQ